MLKRWKQELSGSLRARIAALYGVEHEPVVEVPPRRELGDLAFPAPLHLARQLKKPPRAIAQEILDGLQAPPWVREVRLAGAGYLNFFLARSQAMARLLSEGVAVSGADAAGARPENREKVIVEHTNINPNKAAHIGHLRNAVLGDVLVEIGRAHV